MQNRLNKESPIQTYILLAFVFAFIGFVVGLSQANDPHINLLGTVPEDFAKTIRYILIATMTGLIAGLVLNIDRFDTDILTRSTIISLIALGSGIATGFLLVSIAPFDLMQAILRGIGVTLGVTAMGIVLALIVSIVAGVTRTSRFFLIRFITRIYIEVFRGTSVIVQLYWIYFVLPVEPFNINISAFEAGVLALGLNVGAYGAEVVRGAIQSIPKGQIEATIALNMTRGQRMRRVILPLATVRMIPPLGNLMIELLKASSLVSLITLADITFQTRSAQQVTGPGRATELYILLLFLYFAMAYPMTLTVRWIERQRQWA
jgi:polar amino acid transport system permease protein